MKGETENSTKFYWMGTGWGHEYVAVAGGESELMVSAMSPFTVHNTTLY